MRSTPRRRLSGKVRAVLSLGMLLGIAQVGTLAAWSDGATVQSGTFATGTLDLRVGENAADQLGGQGGTWNHASLTLSDLAPGESVAQMLTVGNAASIALTYNGTVSTSNATLSGPNGLQLTVMQGATAADNTGAHADNNRQGTCTGGTAALSNVSIGTSPTTIHTAPVALTTGMTTSYCVIAKLADGAPNSMQGQSTNIEFSFEADQR